MFFSYVVTLTCIWWICFYIILPFGSQITVNPEEGHADSAPTKPRLALKIAITSFVSIILTIGMVYLIENHYLSSYAERYLRWLSEF